MEMVVYGIILTILAILAGIVIAGAIPFNAKVVLGGVAITVHGILSPTQ